jgi:division protein CdvB (Snf7/Vps24/ESCRT-III family)
MSNFSSNWNKGEKQYSDSDGLGARLRNAIRSPEPLKPKLEIATRQIQIQIAKLSAKSDRLSEKDKLIFEKVVACVQKHDRQHANMLANELSEIRKMGKLVTQSKLAFEQIELRINTIKDMGDIAASLSPAVGIIKGISSGLNNVLPEAEGEINEISSMLSGILVDAGQMSYGSINFETANGEAEKILAEAGVVAERNMQDKFPDLPSTLSKAYENEDGQEGEQLA